MLVLAFLPRIVFVFRLHQVLSRVFRRMNEQKIAYDDKQDRDSAAAPAQTGAANDAFV